MVKTPVEIQTNRLLLRPWRESDLDAFAKINQDPKVMNYFLSPLTREESDTLAKKIISLFDQNGYGLFAVEIPGECDFIGFVGLLEATFPAPFTPAMEIGWRLDSTYWGRGFAPEAAQAVLDFAFNQLKLEEIVSFTPKGNHPSRRVMEKIGMRCDPKDDFDYPTHPEGHPLKRHVLYRIRRP